MGRKVNPIGFRLGINKTWESRWFAEGKEYAQRLHQDAEIRRLILRNATDAAIARVEIERDHNLVRVFVFTAKPGVFIGRKGAAVKELRQHLEKITGCKVDLKVQEISQPDIEATLVADNIARQLERRISHNRAMKRAISQAMRQGAQGDQDHVRRAPFGKRNEADRMDARRARAAPMAAGRYRLRPLGSAHHLRADRGESVDLQGRVAPGD